MVVLLGSKLQGLKNNKISEGITREKSSCLNEFNSG
jgi:hypothetical protein